MWAVAALLILFSLLTPARAVQPDEILKDPALEARARHLSQELRCLVCQNQSIDDSNAELARDLRVIVRERISAGDSDGQVLLRWKSATASCAAAPAARAATLLLWLTPMLVLAVVAIVLYRHVRSRPAAAIAEAAPLSTAEQQRSTSCWQQPALAACPIAANRVPGK